MDFPLVLIVAFGALVALLLVLARGSRSGSTNAPLYECGPALFTGSERSFFGVLEQAVGEQYRIFGKVRLADILGVRSDLIASERQGAQNRLTGKHVDFVLCRPDDLSVAAVIELDDKSHGSKKRQARDQFVDAAFRAAGLPIYHFAAKATYDLRSVREELADLLTSHSQHL